MSISTNYLLCILIRPTENCTACIFHVLIYGVSQSAVTRSRDIIKFDSASNCTDSDIRCPRNAGTLCVFPLQSIAFRITVMITSRYSNRNDRPHRGCIVHDASAAWYWLCPAGAKIARLRRPLNVTSCRPQNVPYRWGPGPQLMHGSSDLRE